MLQKAFSLGLGLALVSKEKVEKVVDDLVKRGELAPVESKALVEKLLERGEEEQGRLRDWMNEQVTAILKQTSVASTKDVEELTRRVAELEIKLSELQHP